MSQSKIVTEDGLTASQTIRHFADVYLENAGWMPPVYDKRNALIEAYRCLRDITMGGVLNAGIVPLSTPDVMYRPDGGDVGGQFPDEFALHYNYPNPFNPVTKISFSLPEAAEIRLEVYNVAGQEVATLIDNEFYGPGSHSATWDGSAAATGVYLYRLEAGSFTETKKMLLLK